MANFENQIGSVEAVVNEMIPVCIADVFLAAFNDCLSKSNGKTNPNTPLGAGSSTVKPKLSADQQIAATTARNKRRATKRAARRAEIREATPEWLDRSITVSDVPDQYSDAVPRETTWRGWLEEKFVLHENARAKDEAGGFLSTSLSNYTPWRERFPDKPKSKNVRDENTNLVHMMIVDIDGNQSYAEASKVFEKHPGFAYSSFNHLVKTSTDGTLIEKFREVLPLAEPIVITPDRPDGMSDEDFRVVVATNAAVVKRAYELALVHLGLNGDPSCKNVGHLFYYPAHLPTDVAEDHSFIDYHFDGELFDMRPFVEAARKEFEARPDKAKGKSKTKARAKPVVTEVDAMTARYTPTTVWLPRFLSVCGPDAALASAMCEIAGAPDHRTGTGAAQFMCSLRYLYEDHAADDHNGHETMYVFDAGTTDEKGEVRTVPFIGCNHGRCSHPIEAYLDAFIREHGAGKDVEAIFLKHVPPRIRHLYLENRALPSGFWYSNDVIQTMTGGANPEVMDVCQRFEVNGTVHDENGDGTGIEIAFVNQHGRSRTYVVRRADLQSQSGEYRITLADMGFSIGTKQRQREAFADLLNRIRPEKRIVVFSRPGWHTVSLIENGVETKFSVFVTVQGEVIGPTPENVIYRLSMKSGIDVREKVGTLDGWKDGVALFDERLLHLGFGLLIGAAGPIVGLLGRAPINFYLLGTTSVGKTLAQRWQVSVWGPPTDKGGCLVNLESTPNASEATLHMKNGCTIAYDEAGRADAKLLQKIAFAISAGRGRERLNKNIELRDVFEWVLSASISGEKPKDEYLRNIGVRANEVAGETVRMPEINLSSIEPSSPEKIDAIREALNTNYGWAGPALVHTLFARGFVDDPSGLKLMVDDRVGWLVGDRSGPMRRTADSFAICWAAGDIMQEAGVLPVSFDVEAVVLFAWDCFASNSGAEKLDAVARAVEHLKTSLQTRPDVVRGSGDPKAGLAAYNAANAAPPKVPFSGAKAYFDGEVFYVPKTFFDDFIGTTAPADAVLLKLQALDVLELRGKNRAHNRIPGKATEGPPKDLPHYRLVAAKLFGSDTPGDDQSP